jgi:hypothetical protein
VSVVTLVIEEKGGSLSRYAESDTITPEPAVPRAPAVVPPAPIPERRPRDAPALSAPAVIHEQRREDAAAARSKATKPAAEATVQQAERSDRAAAPPSPPEASRELGSAAGAGSAESAVAQGGVAADAAAPALRRAVPERSGNQPRGGAYAPAAAAKAAPVIPPAVLRELEGQPPEKWLERIETFRREGDAALAEALRAEFRRRFPDQPASR